MVDEAAQQAFLPHLIYLRGVLVGKFNVTRDPREPSVLNLLTGRSVDPGSCLGQTVDVGVVLFFFFFFQGAREEQPSQHERQWSRILASGHESYIQAYTRSQRK